MEAEAELKLRKPSSGITRATTAPQVLEHLAISIALVIRANDNYGVIMSEISETRYNGPPLYAFCNAFTMVLYCLIRILQDYYSLL